MTWKEGVRVAANNLLTGLGDYMGQGVDHYCILETAEMEVGKDRDGNPVLTPTATLVSDDGSLVTLIQVRGQRALVGAAEFSRIASTMTETLSTRLKARGHAVQITFNYDPTLAQEQINAGVGRTLDQSVRQGLSIEEPLRDWHHAVANYITPELVLISAWTTKETLPKAEGKHVSRERQAAIRSVPQGTGAQNVVAALPGLRDIHASFVKIIANGLDRAGCLHEVLDARTALRVIKQMIDPMRGKNWSPLLPGDRLPLRGVEPGTPESDYRYLLYPSLKSQLFSSDAVEEDAKTLLIGDRLHHPVLMTLPPQQPGAFTAFFSTMIRQPFPWRINFLLEGDGLSRLGLRQPLAFVSQAFSRTSKAFVLAIQDLENRALGGETLVGFRLTADTWIEAQHPNAKRELQRQANALAAAFEGWGSAAANDVTGDPLLGLCASLPAVMRTMPSYPACAPLNEVVRMLPLMRPVSVWRNGTIPFRTPDGKLVPYLPGSGDQASWIEAGIGAMGGGKSVLLSTINLAFLCNPALDDLPYIAQIDVGFSSRGFIQMVRDALPPDRKHLAVFRSLQRSADHAINPCDTELGCEELLPRQKATLVNILCILGTPDGQIAPPEGFREMAGMCVDRAFENLSQKRNPRRYLPHADETVDGALTEERIEIKPETTWWQVVRGLFDRKRYYEASVAQRYAVPTVPEVGGAARDPAVVSVYGNVRFGGETLVDYFTRKIAIETPNKCQVLNAPTRFEVREARIVAIDMQEIVNGETSEHLVNLYFLLAKRAAAGKFSLMPDDVERMPEWTRAYHRVRIEAIRRLPKREVFDEAHRIFKSAASVEELVTEVRESRKWNVHMGFYSQEINDLPNVIRDLTTTFYLLGVQGDAAIAARIAEVFQGGDTLAKALVQIPSKPGAGGSRMVAIYRTTHGQVAQNVMNTVGAQMLWRFSTTTEDVTVRDKLSAELGGQAAIGLLARHYPGGVKRVLEEMAQEGEGIPYERLLDRLRALATGLAA